MTELSVVLISKNQEWNIARLVESVLRETDALPSREIVLVDSASTDRTTEIAARYPIAVLKLCPEQRLTAAAGRYVGYKRTTGDLVLFLDGDMELVRGVVGSSPRRHAIQVRCCRGMRHGSSTGRRRLTRRLWSILKRWTLMPPVWMFCRAGVPPCIAVLFWSGWARLTLICIRTRNPSSVFVSGMQDTESFVCLIPLRFIIRHPLMPFQRFWAGGDAIYGLDSVKIYVTFSAVPYSGRI